jgi:hypothetical protein
VTQVPPEWIGPCQAPETSGTVGNLAGSSIRESTGRSVASLRLHGRRAIGQTVFLLQDNLKTSASDGHDRGFFSDLVRGRGEVAMPDREVGPSQSSAHLGDRRVLLPLWELHPSRPHESVGFRRLRLHPDSAP